MQWRSRRTGVSPDGLLLVNCRVVLLLQVSAFLTFFALVPRHALARNGHRRTAHCAVNNLRTEVPASLRAIAVERHLFVSDSQSSAVVRIQNRSSKSIIALETAFEYYDSNGKRLGEILVSAIAEQVRGAQAFQIGKQMHNGGSEVIPKAVQPDGTARVGGLGKFTVATCPVRAKLSAARVWFSDGTSLAWSAPDSRIDPGPRR